MHTEEHMCVCEFKHNSTGKQHNLIRRMFTHESILFDVIRRKMTDKATYGRKRTEMLSHMKANRTYVVQLDEFH